jgi:hypothetical protein
MGAPGGVKIIALLGHGPGAVDQFNLGPPTAWPSRWPRTGPRPGRQGHSGRGQPPDDIHGDQQLPALGPVHPHPGEGRDQHPGQGGDGHQGPHQAGGPGLFQHPETQGDGVKIIAQGGDQLALPQEKEIAVPE